MLAAYRGTPPAHIQWAPRHYAESTADLPPAGGSGENAPLVDTRQVTGSALLGHADRPQLLFFPPELFFPEIPGAITFELLIRFECSDMFWICPRSNSFEFGVYDFVGSG